jgi:magnesium transporter
MRTDFSLEEGTLREVPGRSGLVTVFAAPSDDEQSRLVELLGIDSHTLKSALDSEETARVEFHAALARATIIWKAPDPRADEDSVRFDVSSMGIFLGRDMLTVVDSYRTPLAEGQRVPGSSVASVALHLMRGTIEEFQARLRVIRRTSSSIQARLNQTIDNRELVRMFDLAEDLVFYVDAIEANGAVMTRLKALAGRLDFTDDEVARLEDLIIDNAQCARRGRLYTTVLAGLLDARGNIVNNNMNVLIKNLTAVNVVFLPLGVIAAMGGMSEFTMMLSDYAISTIGFVLWRRIGKWIGSQNGGTEAVDRAARRGAANGWDQALEAAVLRPRDYARSSTAGQ